MYALLSASGQAPGLLDWSDKYGDEPDLLGETPGREKCFGAIKGHVAMARTHCAEVLQEAVSKYLRRDLYRHKWRMGKYVRVP